MKQAVIYARYSPRPNAREDTITRQFEQCEQYCAMRGFDVVAKMADEQLSGKNIDRPQLQMALRQAKLRKAVLVVASLSRLARNTIDAINIAEDLDNAGAGLVMLDLNIDSTTATGKLIFTVFAALAAFEREQTAERTSQALRHMMANGKRVSRHPPYGWDFDESGRWMIENQYEQSVIGHILQLDQEGFNESSIAAKLNKYGVKTKGGQRWRTSHVKRILTREFARLKTPNS